MFVFYQVAFFKVLKSQDASCTSRMIVFGCSVIIRQCRGYLGALLNLRGIRCTDTCRFSFICLSYNNTGEDYDNMFIIVFTPIQ